MMKSVLIAVLAGALSACLTPAYRTTSDELVVPLGEYHIPGGATTEDGREIEMVRFDNPKVLVGYVYYSVSRYGGVGKRALYEPKYPYMTPGHYALVHITTEYDGKVLIWGRDGNMIRTVRNTDRSHWNARRKLGRYEAPPIE